MCVFDHEGEGMLEWNHTETIREFCTVMEPPVWGHCFFPFRGTETQGNVIFNIQIIDLDMLM